MEISIHPPRGGRDPAGRGCGWSQCHFNPPSPWGEGPFVGLVMSFGFYFNPPSPWGEGRFLDNLPDFLMSISIHPPRGGRDDILAGVVHAALISIHPPRGGRDDLAFF